MPKEKDDKYSLPDDYDEFKIPGDDDSKINIEDDDSIEVTSVESKEDNTPSKPVVFGEGREKIEIEDTSEGAIPGELKQTAKENEKEEEEEEETTETLYKDKLTGLLNRRYYRKEIENIITESHENNQPISLALIDIDDFREINKDSNKKTGDNIIKNLGKILIQNFTEGNIPIRYAGDEFIILFSGKNKEDIKQELESLIETSREQLKKNLETETSREITISIGVSSFPVNALDADNLFKRADEALYEAKKQGKDRIVFYPDKGKLIAITKVKNILPKIELIGHDDVLTNIKNSMFNEDKNKVKFPIIYGESGFGKTKILNEIESICGEQNIWALFCKGYSGWGNKPYKSILHGLNRIFYDNPELLGELIPKLSKLQKQVLEKHLPIIKDSSDEELEEIPEDLKLAFFNSLNKILIHFINTKGLVILLDDIQWVDTASLELCDALYAEFKETNLWLAGSVLKTKQGIDQDWGNIINYFVNMNNRQMIKEIPLEPLDENATEKFIKAIFPNIKAPKNFFPSLFAKTKGNPLFIRETLSNLVQREVVKYANGNWIVPQFGEDDISFTLESTIISRINNLNPETIDILRKAVIIGNEFDVTILSELMEMSESQVLESIEEARNAQLIEEVKGSEGMYAFIHPITRNLLYDEVDHNKKRKLHEQVISIQKKLYMDNIDDILGTLAYHYSRAGVWDKCAEATKKLEKMYLDAYIPKSVLSDIQRRIRTTTIAKENPLSENDLRRALQVSRLLKIGLQNVRFYPKDNANVVNAIEHLFQELNYFFEHTEAFTLSVIEDIILINGQEPSPDDMRIAPFDEMKELYTSFGLEGLVFIRDMKREELESFLILLTQDPEEVRKDWDGYLSKYNIKHIMPDRKFYIAVGDRRLALEAKKKEKLDVTDFSSTRQQTTEAGSTATIPEGEIDKFAEILEQFRIESARIQEAARASGISDEYLAKLDNILKQAPTVERSFSIEDEDIPPEIAPPQPTDTAPPPEEGLSLLDELGQDVDLLISELKNPNEIQKAKAVQELINKGEEAVEPLHNFIIKENSLRERRLAALIINRLGNEAVDNFISLINPTLETEHLIRIIEIMPLLKNKSQLLKKIHELTLLEDTKIQEATFNLIKNVDVDGTDQLLLDFLRSDNKKLIAKAIKTLGEKKAFYAIPYLMEVVKKRWIWEKEPEVNLQKDTILAIANIQSNTVVDDLINLFKKELPFMLKRNKNDIIRIAICWALGEIGSPKAYSTLKKAMEDRNLFIRQIARGSIEKLTK
ncbi:diguanylate cyclase [bacterium]|nr:diguanylate cyclase [bacterium]